MRDGKGKKRRGIIYVREFVCVGIWVSARTRARGRGATAASWASARTWNILKQNQHSGSFNTARDGERTTRQNTWPLRRVSNHCARVAFLSPSVVVVVFSFHNHGAGLGVAAPG